MGKFEQIIFTTWFDGYDDEWAGFVAVFPLVLLLLVNNAATQNSKGLIFAGTILFHLQVNWYTQALYHIGMLFVTLDMLESRKVKGGNWLDCIIGLGYFLGLVHPLVFYGLMIFLHLYCALNKRDVQYLAIPILVVADVFYQQLWIHLLLHAALVMNVRDLNSKGVEKEAPTA